MNADLRVLDAVLTLADRELARDQWVDRTGALRALLTEAVPFLRMLREQMAEEVTA